MENNKGTKKKRNISASEIGNIEYCPLANYFSKNPENISKIDTKRDKKVLMLATLNIS